MTETGTDLDVLRRWESAGGTWFVYSRTGEVVTVALCRCDSGEEVERLVSNDPALREYVETRPTSEDPEPS